ncbi:unnamed protein product [Oncorhynchus mykiss]|uniref:Uncharacterized protein n=1 Tax=Oncorhynchus mykiss TaxID=8022 RepID=A0A060X998_ONCMY|nr:unnamed protein product [Oncorhynchus mykiss]
MLQIVRTMEPTKFAVHSERMGLQRLESMFKKRQVEMIITGLMEIKDKDHIRKENVGKADTGRDDDLIERRQETDAHRREDVDGTRRCSSWKEEDNAVEKIEQDDVVRRVDKDREGVVVKGETHLGETKTSLTKYGESSSSTNRCETIPSHQEFNEVRRKEMQRRKDEKDANYSQFLANVQDNKLREVLERQKKNKAHCGFRRFWGVRGKYTKAIGRSGRVVGMSKKK